METIVMRCYIGILTTFAATVFAIENERGTFIYNDVNGNQKPRLVLDEAWMNFNNSATFHLLIYARNYECWKCDLIHVATILGLTTTAIVVNTTYGTDVEIRREVIGQNLESLICGFSVHFKEHGDYWLFINQTANSCDFDIVNDPMVAEMPILFVAIGLGVIGIVIKIISCLYRKRNAKSDITRDAVNSNDHTSKNVMAMTSPNILNIASEEPVNTHSKGQRLHCLDTLRGLSLVIMLFVNYGGGGYWFFDHPPWNGLTFADLVFPWFVFIMGTSMNYSFRGMLKRGKSRFWILFKVTRRSALLFALGIMLNTNWGPIDLKKLRIPGVLQRLSLSYLGVALMETVFARHKGTAMNRKLACIQDIVILFPEWVISLGLLATYLALTFSLPVPGCPKGYIGPGGLHDGKQYENCTGGAAGYIDRLVFGDHHIYQNPTPKQIYQTVVPYDPEGILGTLSSVFLCFLGLQAGRIFLTYKRPRSRLLRLLAWGIITGAIGAALCKGSQNDGIIPINKNLWSVSFVLVTASFGFILLAILYTVVDIAKLWKGTPFIFAGMNPLILYLCHDIFYRFFPVSWEIEHIHWKLLLQAVWDVAIWMTLGFVLYCKQIFISL